VSLKCGDGEGVSEKGVHTFTPVGPVLADGLEWIRLSILSVMCDLIPTALMLCSVCVSELCTYLSASRLHPRVRVRVIIKHSHCASYHAELCIVTHRVDEEFRDLSPCHSD
jgi:hypothetical protein